jgi:hypothetical protein
MFMKGSNRNGGNKFSPETLIKRQATQHDCWAMVTKEVEKCTVRKKYFVLGQLEQPWQDKNLLYRHHEPNEPTKEEGPLSYVLLESPFASVSRSEGATPIWCLCMVAPITILPYPADGRTAYVC